MTQILENNCKFKEYHERIKFPGAIMTRRYFYNPKFHVLSYYQTARKQLCDMYQYLCQEDLEYNLGDTGVDLLE